MTARNTMTRVERGDPDDRPAPSLRFAPASTGQASLWFLRQVMPYKSAYNQSVQLRLAGDLDAGAIVAAVREIVRRHESCRTTFRILDGSVVQAIRAELPPDVSVVDLSSAPDPEGEADRVACAVAAEPFDLERGPLVRVRLIRVAPRDHTLVVVVDHIIADGMSLGIFWREIEALYRAFHAGEPSPLPPPRRQFAECVVAQNDWLRTAAFEKQLESWRQHLTGATPCDLPTDRPRPPMKTFRGGMVRTRLPRDLVQRLRALTTTARVSSFSALLAALDVLLARYSGRSDISVLIPGACRDRFDADDVVGYFANVLVMRSEVSDRLPFRDFLRKVGGEILSGLARQDVPFERVVNAVRPDRSLSHDPLASVGLSFLPASGASIDLPGIEATYSEVPNGGSRFDLQFFMAESGGGLTCSIEYNADVFDRATIERLLGHYRTILEAVVADPTTTIGELPMLTEWESKRILDEWNATAAPSTNETIVDLVAATAARTPDAIAASFGGRELTYAELSRRSNQVARCLRARGVGPNVLVGICVERSLEMLVGLLGILKAGGAYVPLDPAYPRDRLAFVAEDAAMSALVTEEKLTQLLPPQKGLLRVDADAPEIDAQSDAPLDVPADPDSLAYVIYTSGSTGKPKGVPITHRSVVSFLRSMSREPGMSPADRLLAVISLSFDMAGFELWLPLTVGAHVEIASRETTSDGSALRRRLESGPRVTVLQATPSTFRLLLETGWRGDRAIKLVIGGEALAPELSERLLDCAGSLWNGYGPTETTIFSTLHEMKKGEPVLIGRPIANTQIYILDKNLQPVPVGVSGEIFIGGVGLSRGYVNRPDLTRERFVPDPFSKVRGAQLYRTGDVARYRPDGAIDYQGRNDFQVKLRGYRVELGEIETTLVAHPSVKEAVVAAYQEGPGDQRLVAYVTKRGDAAPDAQALRKHLGAKLPEFMVPSRFMVLAELPLTANAKIDRKALPKPDIEGTATSAASAPRDEVEAKLSAIFRKVLGVKTVGLSDSFFDLGGHSLLAVRLVAEIERELGRGIPLVSLFSARSVEQIAVLLRGEAVEVKDFRLEPIQPSGTKRPLFLMSRPNVNALGYIALARYMDQDRPVYGMQYQYAEENELGRPYTYEEYDEWAKSYVATIRRIQPEGPYLLGGMCEGALIAFNMTRVLEAAGERVALLAIFDAWPQENTVNPLLHRVNRYERKLRAFAKLDFSAQRRKVAHHLAARFDKKLVRPTTTRAGGGDDVDLWKQRMYPGKDFVPPKVAAKITVVRLKKQPYWRVRDELNGWGNRTTGGVDVRLVPGDDHTNFMREPEVRTTGRVMSECIELADPPVPVPLASAVVRRS